MTLLLWTGLDKNNLFNDPFNWAPPTAPNSSSDCFITSSTSAAIDAGNTTINSLSITNAGATLSIASTAAFTLLGAPDSTNSTGASTNDGTILMGSFGDLNLDGGFANFGTLNTAAGSDVSVNSAFVNDGLVLQYGDFTVGVGHMGTVVNDPGRNWFIAGAADISAGGAPLSSFTNAGTLARTGAGVTDVSVATANTGLVEAVNGGRLEFSSPVANFGTMAASGAVLKVDRPVSGTGGLNIETNAAGAGGTVNIVRGSDAGQTVDFLASFATKTPEKLDLNSASTFAGHISGFGFAGTDLIDLVNTFANNAAYNPFNDVLTLSNTLTGATVANLHFNGSYTTSDFHLTTTAARTQISFV